MSDLQLMTPDELTKKLTHPNGMRLIDVREFDEFATVHVDGAQCVPLAKLLERASEWSQQDSVALICHSGQRARQAAAQLNEVGFERVSVVDGGTKACVAAGVPVIKGRNRIPIQRQVLIGAGIVILTGLALAFVHPAFQLISWFAASFLVVAGITGFCPMAIALAFAPWNRSTGAACTGEASSCSTEGTCK